MRQEDKGQLQLLLRQVFRMLAGSKDQKELQADDVDYWFSVLEFAAIEDVASAFDTHMKSERFVPMPADILALLGVKVNPTARQLVAMARKPRCPLGVIARMQIGTQNLNGMLDEWALVAEAEVILDDLHNINKRAQEGRYSNAEVSVMLKHSVDPRKALTGRIYSKSAHQLNARMAALQGTTKHAVMIAAPFDKDKDDQAPVNKENIKKVRREIMSMFDDEPAPAEVAEPICETCKAETLVRMKMCQKCINEFVASNGE